MYVAGVKKETTAWPPGEAPRSVEAMEGPRLAAHARAPHRDAHLQSFHQLAVVLPTTARWSVPRREGTRGTMRPRFARLRVQPAHRDEQRAEPRPEEWLLIEWPRGAPGPA